MHVESTINPGIYQKGGSAFGIVQWDPASKYINWAKENGYSTGSMKGQLEFLIYSMQPGRGEWFNNGKTYGYYMSSKDFICSNASVAHLTQTFLYSYERAGIPHLDRRIKYAEYWSNYFS